ncbi:MAG: acylneuraminate cytidylyltransferase family protein [Deltaproteobacteria bacterium]|nr:acylneuraminate cytidylyltransferase family protein [Deltaproteobacteria bacterium]
MAPRIVALIPMREHSVRVPLKNRRAFAGAPLYRWIVHALARCPLIDEIVIDTDSSAIMEDARDLGDRVRVIERPVHLREDTLSMNEVLLHAVSVVDADLYLQTHSTNPLLRSETITRGLERFLASAPAHDSLFSVTRLQTRLWDAHGKPLNHDLNVLLRTQDLPPVYEENSCLYLFTRASLEARRNRIGERPLMFEIDAREAQDIDEEIDFRVAEHLMTERLREAP